MSDQPKSTIERAIVLPDAKAGVKPAFEARRSTALKRGTSVVGRQEKLGEILVQQGVLDEEEVARVAAHQELTGLSFGDSAKHLGVASRVELTQALAAQFGYPLVAPGDKTLNPELVAAYQPDAPYTEQLRRLRSELLASAKAPQLVLSVVSPRHGEGRSHLVGNLAIVFAQLRRRVLVVDADLRRPRQHQLFKLDNDCGVSVLLSGRKCDGSLRRVQDFPELAVMTAGPRPPNPQELIAGGGMQPLLRSAKKRYDVILIDTPPATDFADAEILALASDTTLIVARKHQTRHRRVLDLAARLKKKDINVAGCVLVA